MIDYSRAWLGYPDTAFANYPWPPANFWGIAELIFLRAHIVLKKSVVDDSFATLTDENLSSVLKCLPHDLNTFSLQEQDCDSVRTAGARLSPDSLQFYQGLNEIVNLLRDSATGIAAQAVEQWRTLDVAIGTPPVFLQRFLDFKKRIVLCIEARARLYRVQKATRAIASGQGTEDDIFADVPGLAGTISTLPETNIKRKGRKLAAQTRKKQKLSSVRSKACIDNGIKTGEHDEPSPLSLVHCLRIEVPQHIANAAAEWDSRPLSNDWIGHLLRMIITIGGFSQVLEYSDQPVEHCIRFQHGLRRFSGIIGPSFQTKGCVRLYAGLEHTNTLPLIHIERGASPGISEIDLPISFAARELASMLAVIQDRIEYSLHRRGSKNGGTVFTIGVYGRKVHISKITFEFMWLTAISRQRFDKKDNPRVTLQQTKWYQLDRKDELHEFITMVYRLLSQLSFDILTNGRRV